MIWTMLGIAMGVMAAYCMIASFLLATFPALNSWRALIAAAFAAQAVFAWFLGRRKAQRRAADQSKEELWPPSDLRFHGAMLLIIAGITLFIHPLFWRKQEPPPAVAVRPPSKPPVVAPPPAPPPPAVVPVVFPKLKLQGLIIRDNNSMAIINGQSYGVGDTVEGAVVKAIERNQVILELGSEVQTLKLE